MLVNRLEKALMNNPIRAVVQRYCEARILRDLGGAMAGGRALEIGCGRGVGVSIILDSFGAEYVDAFDLDPSMVEIACRRHSHDSTRVRLWVGDAVEIEAADDTYDAVFDFGIVHHVPQWLSVLDEVHRVLKPGGRFYSEEVLKAFILTPVVRRVLDHPLADRFSHEEFLAALTGAGFSLVGERKLGNLFGWYVGEKG